MGKETEFRTPASRGAGGDILILVENLKNWRYVSKFLANSLVGEINWLNQSSSEFKALLKIFITWGTKPLYLW